MAMTKVTDGVDERNRWHVAKGGLEKRTADEVHY